VRATCSHLDQIAADRPAPADVCPACVEIGSPWVHLRQCLVCGATNCCDSSPNRHASRHFDASHHPLMQTLENGEDWVWCFVDRLTLEEDGGRYVAIDPFFDAGLWYARREVESGGSLPFPPGAVADEGFPLGVWETTYRGRHRAGTLDPDQAEALEALPGWRW
jgi:Zn-finger in ubiquitin-hydrolases and other protein